MSITVTTHYEGERVRPFPGMGFPPFFKTLTSTMSYSLMSRDEDSQIQRTGLLEGSHVVSIVLLAINLHLHRRGQRHARLSADNLEQLTVIHIRQ